MDVILNPDKYSHVSEIEAEEMKFDPDYAINFTIEDIQRMLNLPPQIQLALPFLYTPLEMKAHQLLMKYSVEQGEDYFKDLDSKSQDIEVEGDGKGKLTSKQQREAAFQLNCLLKERKCSDIRSTSINEMDDEQKNWIKVDKILNPELYVDDWMTGEERSDEP